jgi:(p)ppGpp synthase/HD superfamily hydrolase
MDQQGGDLLSKATQFAAEAHQGQVRKYTGEPYVTHPLAVMELVQKVPHTTEMLVAAILHDVVEDTPVELTEILDKFGPVVATCVDGLTDVSRPEDGNRAERKALDRAHTAKQPAEVQTIKLADLIHNTLSIQQHDPSFYRVYKQEKKALLTVLTKGDQTLMWQAQQQIGGQ